MAEESALVSGAAPAAPSAPAPAAQPPPTPPAAPPPAVTSTPAKPAPTPIQALPAAGARPATATAAADAEDVRPYKIHVSTKYLDLTKQKLELTRLPHESRTPKSDDWWEPKPLVEPLIDFWLEKYSWRVQETALNSSLPQFRTAVSIPAQDAPLRLHFVHARSRHANAIPLLLIPPFPFTNLSFGHLVKPLTDPDNVETDQPFHLVIPALPGLGFSDALPNNTPVISTIADLLNTLMGRLSYDYYLATNAGPSASSPAQLDWKLLNYLATAYPSSCLGSHLISPPLAAPRLAEAPIEWAKWSIANFFHVGILGYSTDDFSALDSSLPGASAKPPAPGASKTTALAAATSAGSNLGTNLRKRFHHVTPAQFGLNELGLREPNTLAYALCDSPIGLLVFVLQGLRILGGSRANFTSEQIVTLASLAWLPGPEYAMRLWAHCMNHPEKAPAVSKPDKASGYPAKPRVAITVFLGGADDGEDGEAPAVGAGNDAEAVAVTHAEQAEGGIGKGVMPRAAGHYYACPSWGNARFEVVFSQRMPGRAGLLAWERPEVIVAGVRGLAKEVRRLDQRLQPAAQSDTAALEQVIVAGEPSGGDGSAQARGPGATSPVPTLTVPAPAAPGETPSSLPSVASPILATIKESLNEPAEQGRLQLPLRPMALSSMSGSGSGSDYAKMTLGTSSGTLLDSPRPQTQEGETPPIYSKDFLMRTKGSEKEMPPAIKLDKVEAPPGVTELSDAVVSDVESPYVHTDGFESPAPRITRTDSESTAYLADAESKASLAPGSAESKGLRVPGAEAKALLTPPGSESSAPPSSDAEKAPTFPADSETRSPHPSPSAET